MFGIRVTGFGGGGGSVSMPVTTDALIAGAQIGTPVVVEIPLQSSSVLIRRVRMYIEELPLGDIDSYVNLVMYTRAARAGKDEVMNLSYRFGLLKVTSTDWLSTDTVHEVDYADRCLAGDLLYFMGSGSFSRVNYSKLPLISAESPSNTNVVGTGISRVLEFGNLVYTDEDGASQLHVQVNAGHPVAANYRIAVDYLTR